MIEDPEDDNLPSGQKSIFSNLEVQPLSGQHVERSNPAQYSGLIDILRLQHQRLFTTRIDSPGYGMVEIQAIAHRHSLDPQLRNYFEGRSEYDALIAVVLLDRLGYPRLFGTGSSGYRDLLEFNSCLAVASVFAGEHLSSSEIKGDFEIASQLAIVGGIAHGRSRKLASPDISHPLQDITEQKLESLVKKTNVTVPRLAEAFLSREIEKLRWH